eukprot:Opistho-1_new@105260
MMQIILFFLSFLLLFFPCEGQGAVFSSRKKALPIERVDRTGCSQDLLLSSLQKAYSQGKWKEVIQHAKALKSYPESIGGQEASFYLGVGYLHLGQDDLANRQFSEYLKRGNHTPHFEEVLKYKWELAKRFEQRGGRKKILRFYPGRKKALRIYEEIIQVSGKEDLIAEALLEKGRLLWQNGKYQESKDVLRSLINRFPQHQGAQEGYLELGNIYLAQSQVKSPDPDLLELARQNKAAFERAFSDEEKSARLENKLRQMTESYARSLYERGEFFERVRKKHAAVVYYLQVVSTYPETKMADKARLCLQRLGVDPEEKK